MINCNSRRSAITRASRIIPAAFVSSVALTSVTFAQDTAQEATISNSAAADVEIAETDKGDAEIVVTARRRSETLIDVPVVVTALRAEDLERNRADSLSAIGQLVPSLVVGNYGVGGGGSVSLRGVSTTAGNNGLEQSVSVAIDGVQTSKGRVATLGFFDLQQVEVLKGPQALLFGKNSPGGVISIKTAGPTDELRISASAAYEFVGNEKTFDFAVSGPLGDTAGARLAIRYRDLDGWLYNSAQAIANPFFVTASGAPTGAPAGVAQLPGASEKRPGTRELMGRFTFEAEPTDTLTLSLKVFGQMQNDQKPGATSQNIGPCPTGVPRMYGIVDPFGECEPDNRTTGGDLPSAITDTITGNYVRPDGGARQRALISSFSAELELGNITLNSLSGLNLISRDFFDGADQTTYSQLAYSEDIRLSELTQEFRVTSDFDGPFDFMAGGFLQRATDKLHIDAITNHRDYNPATGRFSLLDSYTRQKASSVSVFGQGILRPVPDVEIAGGLRWSRDEKSIRRTNAYGIRQFNVSNTMFPGSDELGVLKADYSESNVSPEVTASWHPRPNTTLFASYRTGFKSGGYNLQTNLSASTVPGDLSFRAEKARGFEVGGKGLFLDNRLRLNVAAFRYDFNNLQVSAFDPIRFASVTTNAGRLRQYGAEFEINYKPTETITLHSALSYVHNRYNDYVGQCYAFTFPAGTTRATAVAPPNCSFGDATTLRLQQDFDGRAPARSPELSGNAGFVAAVPISDYNLEISGDAFYTSSYFASETMSPFSLQPSFWRFNAGVRLMSPDERWTLSLLGRNLTNRYYITFATDRTGGSSLPGIGEQRGVVARGREVELRLSAKF